MKSTIHDVAKQAGVSTKTVSRVINNQGEISPEKRARVRAVIKQLGYRPNILARSLVNQRSHMLGVVTWGLDYYAPSRIVVGIEQQSRKLGYSLFLHLISDPTQDNGEQILETLAVHRVDGIIYAIPEVGANHDWVRQAHLADLPPLVFMNTQPRPGFTSVSINNRMGAMKATRHLIELGRHRIGIITGPAGWWEAGERLAGWQDALQQAGLKIRQEQVVQADWSVESGMQAMEALIDQSPGIDAVFASSDDIALGALTAAARRGRRIPGDIALVGFDNIPQAAYFQPPLTTIHQPLAQIGRLAVDSLHLLIGANASGEKPPNAAVLQEPELVIRASSNSS